MGTATTFKSPEFILRCPAAMDVGRTQHLLESVLRVLKPACYDSVIPAARTLAGGIRK